MARWGIFQVLHQVLHQSASTMAGHQPPQFSTTLRFFPPPSLLPPPVGPLLWVGGALPALPQRVIGFSPSFAADNVSPSILPPVVECCDFPTSGRTKKVRMPPAFPQWIDLFQCRKSGALGYVKGCSSCTGPVDWSRRPLRTFNHFSY